MQPGRIAYEPALDGLRGLALYGVLAFHAEFSWARGGFLPLPTFFVLSGFLITSLLLAEWESTGTIRLRTFWARRLRRLMPGSLVALGAMSLFGWFFATPGQIERLQGDVLWTLAYMANWRFLISDAAYTRLFVAPSPVQHFWSLAVEEQFYLLYPLIAIFGLRLRAGGRKGLGGLLAAIALLSFAVSTALTISGASVDRVYYGTDSRGSELAVGCLLAVLLHDRPIASPQRRRAVEWAGAAGLLVMVTLWSFVELEWRWLYSGGLLAYSLLSALVIAAAVQPGGPVRRLLAGRFLRFSGRVSYGVYLFHWPIYLMLSSERTGLDPAPLFALRLVVTFALATLSYEYFEAPIRTGRALTHWRPFVVTPTAIVAVALAITFVVEQRMANTVDLHAALEALQQARDSAPGDGLGPPPNRFEKRPRIAFYGDSTALAISYALGTEYRKSKKARPTGGTAQMGCGLNRRGRFRFRERLMSRPEGCGDRDELYAASLERARADLVVISFGPWDVLDRKLPGVPQWLAPGDRVFDAELAREIAATTELLSRDGALVIWLSSPSIQVRQLDDALPDVPYPESDPARMHRFNELLFALERERPDIVRVVDLASYVRDRPGGEFDRSYRPDGIHLTRESAARVADDWLADEILRTYRDAAESSGESPPR